MSKHEFNNHVVFYWMHYLVLPIFFKDRFPSSSHSFFCNQKFGFSFMMSARTAPPENTMCFLLEKVYQNGIHVIDTLSWYWNTWSFLLIRLNSRSFNVQYPNATLLQLKCGVFLLKTFSNLTLLYSPHPFTKKKR